MCRSELFDYTSVVSYAVICGLVSLDRVSLKKRVVDSPEIRSVIGHVPALESCLNAMYDCNYKEFFRVSFLVVLCAYVSATGSLIFDYVQAVFEL